MLWLDTRSTVLPARVALVRYDISAL